MKPALYAISVLALFGAAAGPAHARETKTIVLLEPGGAAPIQCGGAGISDSKQVQRCTKTSETESESLRGEVLVEMRLDPNCAGMTLITDFKDVGAYGSAEDDYINVAVTYWPLTNTRSWWLNIVRINRHEGPPYMSREAADAKEIAHNLCYIIKQEKRTRR